MQKNSHPPHADVMCTQRCVALPDFIFPCDMRAAVKNQQMRFLCAALISIACGLLQAFRERGFY